LFDRVQSLPQSLVGKRIRELADRESARGVFLRKIVRVGEPMPFTAETRAERGDVLSLIAARAEGTAGACLSISVTRLLFRIPYSKSTMAISRWYSPRW